jgi:nucleoside phosphorylase
MKVLGHVSRRTLAVGLAAGIALAGFVLPNASAEPSCVHPTLIVTAMPLELNPFVAQAGPLDVVQINGRRFYVGKIGGNDVVLAMSGIGLVNAEETATAAFEHFPCSFHAAMFSGVAGSQHNIGDVTIPSDWKRDDHITGVNAAMLATATALNNSNVTLSQDVPVGDAACLCPGVDAATPVHMPQPMEIYVGGHGVSTDTFAGHAIPCVPGGGDIEGCEPCFAAGNTLDNAARFASQADLIADPAFWQAMFQQQQTTTDMDAQDEETAAVAEVAAAHAVPFLGVRAASDGQNDPLHLPGFPFQFAVYRQLAGDNAAAVTLAFLQTWGAQGRPV